MCEFVGWGNANIQVLTVIKDWDSLLLRDSGLSLLPPWLDESDCHIGGTHGSGNQEKPSADRVWKPQGSLSINSGGVGSFQQLQGAWE